jgi:hypothetical protein
VQNFLYIHPIGPLKVKQPSGFPSG